MVFTSPLLVISRTHTSSPWSRGLVSETQRTTTTTKGELTVKRRKTPCYPLPYVHSQLCVSSHTVLQPLALSLVDYELLEGRSTHLAVCACAYACVRAGMWTTSRVCSLTSTWFEIASPHRHTHTQASWLLIFQGHLTPPPILLHKSWARRCTHCHSWLSRVLWGI